MALETRTWRYEILARAAESLAAGLDLRAALEVIATAAAEATGAELAVVRVLDPVTFCAVPALMLMLALIAAWVPARRAAAVDPMETLRNE